MVTSRSLLLALYLAAAIGAEATGATYYIDCAHGNDAAAGLSPEAAWRTLAKVSDATFQPGDAVRFRRGTSCAGMLWPKGSGRAGAFITLGAWGSGSLPVIRSGRNHPAALKLFDQQFWRVENLEFNGGEPYGIHVSGSRGVLRGIHIVNVVVHDVTGEPASKDTGLVVIGHGAEEQRFDDVLLDGITAYRTSQWAGIIVGGARFGAVREQSRSSNVVVRNCTVYDVAGDGIILFGVNRGRIENSAAWHTGMQETESIGTPNGMWTWMCRDCLVQGNEVFLTDSPGVDGGAFDIDFGNDDNTVSGNYGHDTQGYCVAVFGAGRVTSNSVVRDNICTGNGRSPRLARRQGAVFLYTWDEGKLSGLRVEGNRIDWNPPIAAAWLVNRARFDGQGTVAGNTVRSSSRLQVEANTSLLLDRNRYERTARGERPRRYRNQGKPLSDLQLQDAAGRAAQFDEFRGSWVLISSVPAPDAGDLAARGQITLTGSAHRQFAGSGLKTLLVAARPASPETAANLKYDWNLGSIPLRFVEGVVSLSTVLVDPRGQIVWSRDGLTPPGELGLAL
ncbi:MAG TPA: right-handed parallel beta-helix repeat-containing protein, partial [Bryobacteraceae bacterium]|nr:right-handed parallel beta-helix repeat-containing protein [Bryobacteraceae bacterium]